MRLLICLLSLASSLAWARLNDKEATIESDRRALGTGIKKTVRAADGYFVHEMVAHGTTIHEYVNAQGTVFAVTWSGMKDPDLSVLLGEHFSEYDSAIRQNANGPGRKPVSLKTDSITVLKSGHFGDMHGKAYVTDLLPTGVSAGDLQ